MPPGWLCEKCGIRVFVAREDHEVNHRARPVEKAVERSGKRGKPRPPRKRVTEEPSTRAIEINERFRAALDAVDKRRGIILVTGGAGTGKSTFIRALRQHCSARNVVVLAPTGIAALTAGGQTIHSFCDLPLKVIKVPEDIERARDRQLVEGLDVVVVDEISMVRADVLDGLECFLRVNRKRSEPFGGVQLVLIGDPLQLPPVVRPESRAEIEERYGSEHFFRAAALKGLRFTPVDLVDVYRQKDRDFVEVLSWIRSGVHVDRALRVLNETCVGRKLEGPHLVLTPTRIAAQTENDARLASLPGKATTYEAIEEGSFTSKSEDNLPAPSKLMLKRGAQVMFTKNDAADRWVNGTLGLVTRVGKESVEVELQSGDAVKVERASDVAGPHLFVRRERKEGGAGDRRHVRTVPADAGVGGDDSQGPGPDAGEGSDRFRPRRLRARDGVRSAEPLHEPRRIVATPRDPRARDQVRSRGAGVFAGEGVGRGRAGG